METLKALLSSKKFLVAAISVIAHAAGRYGFDVDQEAMLTILSPLYAYVIGQGIADSSKAKVPA